jgi:hypothetical protein
MKEGKKERMKKRKKERKRSRKIRTVPAEMKLIPRDEVKEVLLVIQEV